ncbi:MAG: hypothetical protein LEGION0398_MBIBDBAK_00103 [Legionellaceae bacterium]
MKKKISFLLLIFITILLISLSIIYPKQIITHLNQLKFYTENHLVIAIISFISIYILSTIIIFLPISFLTLIGGWLFGPLLGCTCNFCGALIGASLSFLVSRYFAKNWILKHMNSRLNMVRQGISQAGWKFVALARLIPLLPFNVINCLLGLTDIKFKEYLLATAFFILPAKIAYTYVGSLGLAFISHPQKSDMIKMIYAVGMLITIAITPYVIRYFKKNKLVIKRVL